MVIEGIVRDPVARRSKPRIVCESLLAGRKNLRSLVSFFSLGFDYD
jgi:hypothetical protein